MTRRNEIADLQADRAALSRHHRTLPIRENRRGEGLSPLRRQQRFGSLQQGDGFGQLAQLDALRCELLPTRTKIEYKRLAMTVQKPRFFRYF